MFMMKGSPTPLGLQIYGLNSAIGQDLAIRRSKRAVMNAGCSYNQLIRRITMKTVQKDHW
jgi:hypothetical protein